jgi:hypothetical protein
MAAGAGAAPVTPAALAAAATSATGILAAGAGVAVGLAVGWPVAVAILMGVLALGARVGVAVLHPPVPPAPRMDSFTLTEPWRKFVLDAQVTSRRFRDLVSATPNGPMRDRMTHIAERIDSGVQECWVAAGHGDRLSKARSKLPVADSARQLEQLRAAGQADAGSSAARTAEALQSQLDTAARLDATIAGTRERLQLLAARMSEALARAVELSVDTEGVAALSGLNDEVEGLVGEMESLRMGLEGA